MKVIDKIHQAEKENRCYWSFEYFPPKTQQGVLNLYDRMERMYQLGPEFVDVTWGAGGTTSELTMDICQTAQAVYGLETCMHLTCTNMPKEKIDLALKQAKEAGIQNILALRGDPPRGQVNWTKCENGFAYAIDLVKYIHQEYPGEFCVSVAGYPEGHMDSPDKEADLTYLKAKVDAGASYIVTQLFYDVELFLKWVKKCREIGITVPILPGIMPIQSFAGFKRMTTLCKTIVPKFIHDDLEPIKDDDQSVKEYGVKLAVKMCNQLREGGIKGFHFYTLNLEKSVRLILEGLQFIADTEVTKRLPWQPSLHKNRTKENVRPIFWKNRVRSYVMRTEAWDEFPNGRWGDSRSPAFGELDGYGISLKYTQEEAIKLWPSPTTLNDLNLLFADYCRGQLRALPWSDQPLSQESALLQPKLTLLNTFGFLTINSQPAVNAARSDHPVFGWGPKGGYIYQKAYLEFFVLKHQAKALVTTVENENQKRKQDNRPILTYYLVDKSGDLSSNVSEVDEAPNAVTWGVFPAKEILQPTVVDGASFMAWKDEAYSIWSEWANIYAPESSAKTFLNTIVDSFCLMNIVENDFVEGNIFKIFENVVGKSLASSPLEE